MSRARARPLFLHTSALSDAEYAVYVDALHDVLDEPEPEPQPQPQPDVGARTRGGGRDAAFGRKGGGGLGGGEKAKLTDEELEARLVGMREARAWMRGRYRDVGVSEIDKILHLFMPHVQKECISGGQFLAALRLLMHARAGLDVNEGLVFIQADPSTPTTAHPPFSSTSNASAVGIQAFAFPGPGSATMSMSDPPTSDLPPPPTHPSTTNQNHTQNQIPPATRTQPRSNSNPFILDPAPAPVPQIPPRTALNTLNAANANANDAFNARRASLSSAPTPLPSSSSAIPPPVPPSSSKPKSHTHTHTHTHSPSTATSVFKPAETTGALVTPVAPGSTNPFLQRAKTHSGAVSSGSGVGKTPPLPPRKPTSITAPHPHPTSLTNPTSSPAPAHHGLTPAPAHHGHGHAALTGTLTPSLISPLMKQSLEASKQGHALKRAQAEAERARVLEVIRSSNSNSNSNAGAGAGEHRERERERGRSAGSAGGSRSPTKGLGVGLSVGLGAHGQGHVGIGAGAGHRRPVPSPPRSAVSSVFSASSAGSFDQVASARLGGTSGVGVQRRFGSPDADRFSSVSGVSGVSGSSGSGSSGSSQPSRPVKPVVGQQQQQQQQQIPYSAPPTHPDRRAGVGGSTTPRHALPQAQAHRRSPSYQSTTSAYTSRSQPSGEGLSGVNDDDGRGEGDGDGEGVWPWNGGSSSGGNTSGKRTRPTRSQSMHQQSSPTTTSTSGPFSPSLSSGALGMGRVSPPLPPPRRKTRPESVQLPNQSSTSTPARRGSAFALSSGGIAGDDAAVGSPFANAFESNSGSGPGSLFDRDREKDRDKDKSAAAMPLSLSALQRSLSTLHARAQPVLDRARYKAEAGLSRRGFVPHSHSHSRLYGGGDDERGWERERGREREEEEGVGHLVAHGTGGKAESEDTLGSVGSMGDGTELGVGVDRGGPGGMDFDESDESERGLGVSGRGRTGSGYAFGRERERERDSLKLPVEGEGWRPL